MRANRIAVLCCFAALLLTSCEIEDDLKIESDGGGSYRMKVLLPNGLSFALPEIRSKATHDGFRVVEEGATPDRKFVVLAKEFKNVAELNESGNAFDFQSSDAGFLRREYRFHASISYAPAFTRRLTIILPAGVKSTTAGAIEGNRIRWDCSKGGSLDAVAVGFHLPPLSANLKVAIVAIVAAAALLVWMAAQRRRRFRQPVEEMKET